MLKDFWGNDALDFGSLGDLMMKYRNKIIVTVTNKPFGDSYVLFLCAADENDRAEQFLSDYDSLMESKGITAYGAGVCT